MRTDGSWREPWKTSSWDVSKSYVYSEIFCQMRSPYCTYHNASRALKTHELITAIFAKFFLSSYISLHESTGILTALRMLGCQLVPDFWLCFWLDASNLNAFQTFWSRLCMRRLVDIPWGIDGLIFFQQTRLLRFQILHSTKFKNDPYVMWFPTCFWNSSPNCYEQEPFSITLTVWRRKDGKNGS